MNKRIGKRASNDCLAYWLNKYRGQLAKQENERRNQLKQELLKCANKSD